MIRYQAQGHTQLSPEAVYDFVVVHQPENHPRWEPEVIAVRRSGPPAVGTRGIMVRKEGGRESEVPFEIVDLVPTRKVAYRSGTGGFDLHLMFEFIPQGSGTDIQVTAELKLTGALWLMTPIFGIAFPKKSRRITARLVEVLDETRVAAAVA